YEILEYGQSARAGQRRLSGSVERHVTAVVRRGDDLLPSRRRHPADVIKVDARLAVRVVDVPGPIAERQIAAESGEHLIEVGRVPDRARRQPIERRADTPWRVPAGDHERLTGIRIELGGAQHVVAA